MICILAQKLVEEANPNSLEEAITAIAGYSERKDAYTRLGRRHEEPMEIGMAAPPRATPPTNAMLDVLEKISKAQERLATRLAKLEIGQKTREVSGRKGTQSKEGRPPAWNEKGQPRCFRCHQFGHLARECSGNGSNPQ